MVSFRCGTQVQQARWHRHNLHCCHQKEKGVEIVKLLLLFYSYWKIIKWAIKLLTFCFLFLLFTVYFQVLIDCLLNHWTAAIQRGLYMKYMKYMLIRHWATSCFYMLFGYIVMFPIFFMCTTVGWNSSCHKINLRSNSHKYIFWIFCH